MPETPKKHIEGLTSAQVSVLKYAAQWQRGEASTDGKRKHWQSESDLGYSLKTQLQAAGYIKAGEVLLGFGNTIDVFRFTKEGLAWVDKLVTNPKDEK